MLGGEGEARPGATTASPRAATSRARTSSNSESLEDEAAELTPGRGARAALRGAREARPPGPRREGADGLERDDAAGVRAGGAALRTAALPARRRCATPTSCWANLRPDGRLLRTWKDGRAKLHGYLEDYAYLVDGLLAHYEATFEPRYLQAALELADEMIGLFWDEEKERSTTRRRPRAADHPPARHLRQRHAGRELGGDRRAAAAGDADGSAGVRA